MKDGDIIHENLDFTVSTWNKEEAVYLEHMKTNKELVSRLFLRRYGRSVIMKKHKDINDQDAFWQRAKKHDIHLLARKVIEKFRESIERSKPLYSKNNGKPTSQSTHDAKNKQTPGSSGNEFIWESGRAINSKLPYLKNSSHSYTVRKNSQESVAVKSKRNKMLDRYPSVSSLEDKLKTHYQEKCYTDECLNEYVKLNHGDEEETFNPPPSPDQFEEDMPNCWTENYVSSEYDPSQSNKRKIVVTLPNIFSDAETHFHENSSFILQRNSARPVSSEKFKISHASSNSQKLRYRKHETSRKTMSPTMPSRVNPKRKNEGQADGAYRIDTEVSTSLARQRLQGLPPLQISFHSRVNDPVKYVITNQNFMTESDDVTGTSKSPVLVNQLVPEGKFQPKIHKASIPLARTDSEQTNRKLSIIGVNPKVPVPLSYDEQRASMSSQSSKSSKDSMGNRLNVVILNRKRARQQNKKNYLEESSKMKEEEKLINHYRQTALSSLTQKEKAHRLKVIRSEVYAREKLKMTEKERKSEDLQTSHGEELNRLSDKEINSERKPYHMSEFVFGVYLRKKQLHNEGLQKVHKTVEQNKYLRHCGPLENDAQIKQRFKSSDYSEDFRQKIVVDNLNKKTINL